MSITPEQSRAARGLIGWSQTRVANAAGISLSTIRDFETKTRTPFEENAESIRKALEKAGVIFLDADSRGGPGVRLKTQR